MNSKSGKGGFTLLEILVAMTIIVTIISMVYGSYFAVSKSTQAYESRMALSQRGQKMLGRIARQIRCSYAGTDDKQTQPVKQASRQREMIPENEINYFKSDPDDPAGEVLHLVTTNSFWAGQDAADGLFEVTYKFDKSRGLLSLSQERFIDASENAVEKRNWRPIAENVECLELAFFDGQRWLNNWNFKQKRNLPCAVKIEISCGNENYQHHHYGTIAYVCCRKNQDDETMANTLVAVKKQ